MRTRKQSGGGGRAGKDDARGELSVQNVHLKKVGHKLSSMLSAGRITGMLCSV